MKGYVHVYTGGGKGKTSAALGLIVRACGAGLRVYLGQFIKGRSSGEIRMLRQRFPEVDVEQYGRGPFIGAKPSPEDIAAAREGLAKLRAALGSGTYDVVVADEASVAVELGLFAAEELLRLLDERPPGVELVFTGRGAPARLIERADLVTEMREVKHYLRQGVRARPGIEE